MRKTKPFTKAQYQENFAKIFSVVAQLIVGAFFCCSNHLLNILKSTQIQILRYLRPLTITNFLISIMTIVK